MKLYMFRTVRLSIIRSVFTVHSAMVYVVQICRQLSRSELSSILVLLESCLQTCTTYTIAACTVNKLLSSILVLLESCLQTCMTYTTAECTANRLLMMDRGTVRNM
jgi:hypothetical protein